ncbi:MAG: hypothetical protein KUG78_00260, partial [Kangiellaceae bacterium]|nr:hypothetical protein [Kangiellaceae bacterium]
MSFISELKRRNVFRVAGIYAVVGWVLMQVAGTLEASLNLPEWFDSVITAGLLIGFPIALLLAWAFEMTPEGVKPTELLSDKELTAVTSKMDVLILVGIVAILAMGILQQIRHDSNSIQITDENDQSVVASNERSKALESSNNIAEEVISNNSIAVLPFKDLSQAGDQ